MSNDDDGPDAEVSFEIGICGVVLFGILLILSILAFIASTRHKYSKRIFGFACLMCIFELPRCIALIVQKKYEDQITYILHMFANLFFFMSFTFVCLLLHEAIDLSKTTSPLRSKIILKKSKIETILLTKHSLYITNVIFFIIIIIAAVYCGLASSLFSFFKHDVMYEVYTYFDIIKNLVFSFALLYFGCKLRSRITGFSKQFTVHHDSSYQETLILKRLEFAVQKLIIVMSICIIAFLLRSVMLILKILIVQQNEVSPDGLQAYGMAWWWLSDYLPRVLPVLAFIYFLGNITPPKSFFSKFRMFSADSASADPTNNREMNDANELSQSIASTLYEEEYSMNQITPSLREFFLSTDSAHRPSSLESDDHSSVLGPPTVSPLTTAKKNSIVTSTPLSHEIRSANGSTRHGSTKNSVSNNVNNTSDNLSQPRDRSGTIGSSTFWG